MRIRRDPFQFPQWEQLRDIVPGRFEVDLAERVLHPVSRGRASELILKGVPGVEYDTSILPIRYHTNGLRAAAADPRIDGGILIDPPGLVPTTRHVVRRISSMAVRPDAWVRTLRGDYRIMDMVARRLGAKARERDEAELDVGDEAAGQRRDEVVAMLRSLDDRGARFLFIVTRAMRSDYSYADQIYDLFPEVDLRRMLDSRLYPEGDHTFPRAADRAHLKGDVLRWLDGVAGGG